MEIMKKIILTYLIFTLSVYSYAQDKNKDWYLIDGIKESALSPDDKILLDSILPLYHKTTSDTVKLAYLNTLTENLGDDKLWPRYNDVMLALSENKPQKVYLKYYGAALNNDGYLVERKGNIALAINRYLKALKLREQAGDKYGIAETLHNIGLFYKNREDTGKALEYLLKALKAEQAINNKTTITTTINNIGDIYLKQQRYTEALNYFKQSLKIAEQSADKKLISGTYTRLGTAYTAFKEDKKAIQCYTIAIANAQEAGDKDRLEFAYIELSKLYLKEGKYALAEKYALLSNQIGIDLGYPKIIRDATELLYEVYKKEDRSKDALLMHEQYIQMRDSVNNNEQTKILSTIEHDAKEAQIQLEHEKETAIAATESRRQKTIIYSVSGILVLVLFSSLIIYKEYRQKKKAHLLIKKQKEEVEHSRKEIIDSINYAKLIQQAIFKEEEHISEHLPPHFIFFKSKDIVSGDFYWALEKGEYLYVTAADCTGHGVPGAFLTMLGISFLNEINAKEEMLTPAEILNQLRDKLVKELGKEGHTKDGMDISMIRIHLKNKELIWAGAYNPLWYISNKALHEIKADKQPIGYSEKPMPFTDHVLHLNPTDTLYLFTDGYADQFGGTSGKKFKYKQLSELLLANYHMSMEEQKEMLNTQFENWKGKLEQVDDVTLIGIRV